TLVHVEGGLFQPPTLVCAVAARLQKNRSVIASAFAHNVEATIISDIPNLEIVAILRHGPLLTDLTGRAFGLQNWRAVGVFFRRDFHAEVAVNRRYGVVPGAIADNIELLVVTYLTSITVENF